MPQAGFIKKSFNIKMPFVVLEKLDKLKLHYRAPTLSHTVRLAIEDAFGYVFGDKAVVSREKREKKVKDEKGTEQTEQV